MDNQSSKIGKWSLYGTIIGFITLGTLYTVADEGIESTLPIIIAVLTLLLTLFMINLFPRKWTPLISIVSFLAFTYFLHRSWIFTIVVAILFALYHLVHRTVKDERVTKLANISFFILFLTILIYL